MKLTTTTAFLLWMAPFASAAMQTSRPAPPQTPLGATVQTWTETYYVQLTFGAMGSSTAYLFDKNFVQFPNASWDPKTSAITYPVDSPRFMVGGDYRMVTRDSAGTLTDVSEMPAYTEMNHHLVLGAVFAQYGNYAELPISAGSELTSFSFPEGYGYPMTGAEMGPSDWHWGNVTSMVGFNETGLGGSPDLSVYIEVTLAFNNDPNLTWLFSSWHGDLGMCVPQGAQGMVHNTPLAPLRAQQKTRVVVAIPHVHDHVLTGELHRLPASGGDLVMHSFTPDNSLAHPVEHDDCGGAGQPAGWHVHGTGVGHLPVGGLRAHVYSPAASGPILQPGELLYVRGTFNNPHPQPIDNMLAYLIYYEVIP